MSSTLGAGDGGADKVPDQAEEWRLRMNVMRAELANKQADTAHKERLLRYEPKVIVTSVAASAALFGAVGVVLGYFLARVH